MIALVFILLAIAIVANGQPTSEPTSQPTGFELSPLELDAPWPKFGRNQYNMGVSLYSGVRDNLTNFQLTLEGFDAIPNTPPVIGVDGFIYFGCKDGNLVSVRADGTLQWKFSAGGSINSPPIIMSGGIIYFGAQDAALYGVNTLGVQVFKAELGGEVDGVGLAVGVSGRVYVCATDGILYAFEPPSTDSVWEFHVNVTTSTPLITSDGDIVVGSSDGFLYRISDDITSASSVFKVLVGGRGDSLTSPVYVAEIDSFVVATTSGKLYVVSATAGEQSAEYLTGSSDVSSSPVVNSDGIVYIGIKEGKFKGIDVIKDIVLWTAFLDSAVLSTAAISADNIVYVFTEDGVLHALDGETGGAEIWQFRTQSANTRTVSPAIGADGIVVVGASDGIVYSLGAAIDQCTPPVNFTSMDIITCDPSSAPSEPPSGSPSQLPSSSPTAVPTTPTSAPSYAPTTALRTEVTLSVLTTLSAISAAQFISDESNTVSFQDAIAAVVGSGVSSSDVFIDSVTENTGLRRRLATIACDVAWNLTFISELIDPSGSTHSTVSIVEASITTAISDGTLDILLAAGSTDMTNVVAATPSFGEVFIAILHSAPPSGQPTSQPSGQPTGQPTAAPSGQPSSQPSGQPTGQPTAVPSSQPSSQPTSNPSCIAGHFDVTDIDGVVGTRGCDICPAGTYSSKGGSGSCTKCPLDEVSVGEGNQQCTRCAWPGSTDALGQTDCYGYRFTSDFGAVAGVLSGVLAIYVGCWLSCGGESIAVSVNMVLPMLDHLTDINYVMYERFHLPLYFALAVVFLFAPCLVFTYELYEKGYYPRFLLPFTMLWLEKDEDGNPKHVDFDLNIGGVSLTPREQDNLTKLLWYWIFWVLCIIAQFGTFGLFALWMVSYSVFLLFWWFLGTLLYQSRNLAVGKISVMWYQTWNSVVFEELGVKAERVDRGLMNRALFTGFMLETVPQLLLQIANNMAKGSGAWSATSTASTTMSVYMSLSGIYRFAYFAWWKGYSFDDIPISAIRIPGLDQKYTSLNGPNRVSAPQVRAADRMIRTVSKYFPTSNSEADHIHERRSTFSEGPSAYKDLLTKGVYCEDDKGVPGYEPASLLLVLQAQVALLNDEYSYDHDRIKQAKRTIVVTAIGDGRKNRMIALQNYFKIQTPVDIAVLDTNTRGELSLYLTVGAARRFGAFHTYIMEQLPSIPTLMYNLIAVDSHFNRMLSDTEVMRLRAENPEELEMLFQTRPASFEKSDVALKAFLSSVDGMIEGDKDPARFRPDIWVPRPAAEIATLRAPVRSPEACAAVIEYTNVWELSQALVPDISHEFMLYWEITDYLGPQALASVGTGTGTGSRAGGQLGQGLADMVGSALDTVVGGVEAGGARLAAALGDIEMGAAHTQAASNEHATNGTVHGRMNMDGRTRASRLRSILKQQIQLLTDVTSYKSTRAHRFSHCSGSGNHDAMMQALETIGLEEGSVSVPSKNSPVETGNGNVTVNTVRVVFSNIQLARLCLISPDQFASVNGYLTRDALRAFTANQAYILQHKFQVPWLIMELVSDPTKYQHLEGVASKMEKYIRDNFQSADSVMKSNRCSAARVKAVRDCLKEPFSGDFELYWTILNMLHPLKDEEVLEPSMISTAVSPACTKKMHLNDNVAADIDTDTDIVDVNASHAYQQLNKTDDDIDES